MEINLREHFGLVASIVQKYPHSIPMEESDEWADGMVGLVKAKRDFDPSLGNKFGTYAYYCIRSEIRNGIVYRNRHYYKTLSLDFKLNEETDLYSVAEVYDNASVERIDAIDEIDAIFRRLGEKFAKILWLRIVENITHKEIGKQMGFGRERIRQLEAEAIERAKKIQSCMKGNQFAYCN